MRAYLALGLAATGCLSPLVDHGGAPPGQVPPADPVALQKWSTEALPALRAATCFGCHTATANGAWLVGQSDTDIRASVLAFTPAIVDLGTPANSYLLAKGMHEGPALAPDQASAILDWISAEHDATVGPAPVIETPWLAPSLCTSANDADPSCVNLVPLDGLAPGVVGATIQMIVHSLASGIYVTHLYVDGGASGVHLEHPLFVAYAPISGTIVDSTDRFAAVKLDVAPSTGTCPSAGCVQLDVGYAAFVDFAPTDELAVVFKVLTAPP